MKNVRYSLMCVFLVLVGCGGGGSGGNGQAQPGSTITITPSSVTWNAKGNSGAQLLTQPYTITVLKGTAPMQDTTVQVFLDLSSGSSTAPIMFLLDSSGVVQTSPFQAKTNILGATNVSVVFPVGGGADYKGTLQAFSGAASANSTITITCTDTNAGTPACD